MTIQELINEESYDEIRIYEVGVSKDESQLQPSECLDAEIHEWEFVEDEGDDRNRVVIEAWVLQEREVPYIHVGAPAPNYAINSITTLRGYIVTAAIDEGVYNRTDDNRSGTCNIILSVNATDEQVASIFKKAGQSMIDDGTVTEGSHDYDSASDTGLLYDAATASYEKTEPTRNW